MSGASIETPSDFQDRSAWLAVVGAFQVLLGLMAAGMGLMMVAVSLFAPQGTPGMGMAVGVYGAIAVVLIWQGIGSMLARRWARALMLTGSSLGLAIGVTAFISMLFIFPQMNLAAGGGGQGAPAGFMAAMMFFMMAVLFCIYILLPGVFVLFYRSRHVKATCEWKDPKIRWTDKCPLPVLAMAILLAAGAASCVSVAVSLPIFPVPNGVVTGPVAVLAYLALGVLFAVLTWGFYRLRPAAWWASLAVVATAFLYWGWMLAGGRFNMLAYYEAAGYPPAQIEMIQATGVLDLMQSPVMLVLAAAWACLYLGYLVYLKRFFGKAVAE